MRCSLYVSTSTPAFYREKSSRHATVSLGVAGMIAHLSQSGALRQLTYNQLVSLVTASQRHAQPTFNPGSLHIYLRNRSSYDCIIAWRQLLEFARTPEFYANFKLINRDYNLLLQPASPRAMQIVALVGLIIACSSRS